MIIGIAGRLKSGKSTFAQMLVEELRQHYPAEIKMFSGKLKAVASLITGVPVERWEDQEFKASMLPEWGMTGREFLQRLGTDCVRDNLHTDTWVKALFADYQPDSCWVIQDLRFKNEMEAITSRGGLCVRILRDTENTDLHPSETALDDVEMYQIDNNRSLEDLRASARNLVLLDVQNCPNCGQPKPSCCSFQYIGAP